MVDKWLRFFVVVLSLFSIWVVVSNVRNVSTIHRDNKLIVDSLTYVNDSLTNELFIQSTNLTRYEIALEYLKEESPSCANTYEHILSTKTE